MKDIHDIILGPVLTEKSYDQIPMKKYTFKVAAIEEIFGVQVESVNTSNRDGKLKRQGYTRGRTAKVKKAVVTLKKDSKGIEFFESMVQ